MRTRHAMMVPYEPAKQPTNKYKQMNKTITKIFAINILAMGEKKND